MKNKNYVKIRCVGCNKKFPVHPSRAKTAKYCDRECFFKHFDHKSRRRPNRKNKRRIVKNCPFCHQEFAKFKSEGQIHCSQKCYFNHIKYLKRAIKLPVKGTMQRRYSRTQKSSPLLCYRFAIGMALGVFVSLLGLYIALWGIL